MPPPVPDRLPVSTYRVQLNAGFTLHDAARFVPYLSELGVTELYCSPIFAATPGSGHGYDTCDYSRINPDLGGEEGLAALSARLREAAMGLILDFVPNHMGIDEVSNLWWRDVLENGPSSPYAQYFDIDWHPLKQELQDKLLLPILGDQYGSALDRGELKLVFQDGWFTVTYFEHNLPLNPRQLQMVLHHKLDRLTAQLPADDLHLTEFLSILFHLEHLPVYNETATAAIEDRQREKEVAKRRLATLVQNSSVISEHIERNIRQFNGEVGRPESFALLHQLLEAQPYRLAFWRTATHEINYRRFFDINSLAGIRMEDREVFNATHRLLIQLIREGTVTGVRLDHVDGLFDPRTYFDSLHEAIGPERRIYLVVEKILSENEDLRRDWAVHGTTGYEYLNLLNGVFVDSSNGPDFQKLYRGIGGGRSFDDVAYHSKKLIIATAMASELNVLAHEANRISESDPHTRDFTALSLQGALTEVVACFPVYRTYVSSSGWDPFDERNVDRGVTCALERNPVLESSIFQFLRGLLLPSSESAPSLEEYGRRLNFAMKVQQYTGPVQAKGVEDTAFYRFGPLLSLNEVGGHPHHFGVKPEQYHAGNQQRLRETPLTMSCTSTHDTKRGEDGRARLNVLSEIPSTWREQVRAWSRTNSPARTETGATFAPDASDEYLYYQALLAAWPPDRDEPSATFVGRMREYMTKAVKEKKVHTSWITPSVVYDSAVARFVEETLAGARSKAFLAKFLPFQRRVAELGMINSLAQLTLKLVAPGVPDFYQGSETWNLSLVDPDNRRRVDFEALADAQRGLHPALDNPTTRQASQLLGQWRDGCVKQFVTAAGLRLRRREPDLFLRGDYAGVTAEGSRAPHLMACVRSFEDKAVMAAVPRLTATLCGFEQGLPLGTEVWGDTRLKLPAGLQKDCLQNLFTGARLTPSDGTLEAGAILECFPVALLVTTKRSQRTT